MDQASEDRDILRVRRGNAPSADQSSCSMFPFGSPINTSRRSILSPGGLASTGVDSSQPSRLSDGTGSQHALRGRIRAQEIYGGPLVYGGRSSRAGKE